MTLDTLDQENNNNEDNDNKDNNDKDNENNNKDNEDKKDNYNETRTARTTKTTTTKTTTTIFGTFTNDHLADLSRLLGLVVVFLLCFYSKCAMIICSVTVKINSQSLEHTQVGYI